MRFRVLRKDCTISVRQLAKLVDDSTRLQDDSEGKQQTLQAHNASLAAMEQEVAKVSREQEELRLRVSKLQTERNSLEGNLLRIAELTNELLTQSETRQQPVNRRVSDIGISALALIELREQLQESSEEREGLRQQEVQLVSRQAEISDKQIGIRPIAQGLAQESGSGYGSKSAASRQRD